ncbi:hypothetical protein ABDI04_04855 [Bacillus licheniformis]
MDGREFLIIGRLQAWSEDKIKESNDDKEQYVYEQVLWKVDELRN